MGSHVVEVAAPPLLHRIPTPTAVISPPHADLDLSRLTPTVAEISYPALRHNVGVVRQHARRAGLVAVVKANAYGHGVLQVVEALQDLDVRHFAVATVPEGIRLREAGVQEEILVLAAPLPGFLPAYAAYDLGVTVSGPEVAAAVVEAAGRTGPLRANVKVDTGMSRIGLRPGETEDVVRTLERTPGVTVASLWTHFANADAEDISFSYDQLETFRRVLAPLKDAAEYIHVANSAALLRLPESVQSFDRVLVRTGIALYGLSALAGLAEAKDLHPVMRLKSRVTHVKTVAPGTTVSYGRKWTAPRPSRIATVGAGYADGYPRRLTNRGEVGIGGRRYPVVGAVCMDMFMVDLGAPEGPGAAVEVGDDVVLFGPGGPSTMEVAAWADSIPYEICTGVSSRVPRHYVDDGLNGAASSPLMNDVGNI